MKTVIIGNGILALTTAFRLARKAASSDKIVVIGKKTRPGSATLAAAAMLNSFAEVEEGGLNSEIDLYRFELSRQAARMWPKFALELKDAAGDRLPQALSKHEGMMGGGLGTYVINNTAADSLDDSNFDAILAALKRFEEPFELVDPQTIPNYSPEQQFRATRALYIPSEGWLNPRLIIETVDAALLSFPQIEFIDEQVDALMRDGPRIVSVRLGNAQTISGDRVLLASGATVSEILDRSKLGIDIQRIFYGIGTSIEIISPDAIHTKCVRTPNRGLACGLYTVPYFTTAEGVNDRVIVGASNLVSHEPCEFGRIISVQSLLRGAMEQINTKFWNASVARVNVGWRPTSSDGYPVIGPTSIDNLIIATGTKRDGFHLAPLLSEFIASWVLGKKAANDLRFEWFAPERKLIRNHTREEAIEKAVKHMVSAQYQHGYVPAHGRMSELVIQMYRDDLEKLHDKVGARDWGIPPEMLQMYRYGHIKPR